MHGMHEVTGSIPVSSTIVSRPPSELDRARVPACRFGGGAHAYRLAPPMLMARKALSLALVSLLVAACDADSAAPPGAKSPVAGATRDVPPLALPKLVVATRSTQIGSMLDPNEHWARPIEGVPLEVVSVDGDRALVRTTRGAELQGLTMTKSLGVMPCEPTPIGDRWLAGRHDVLPLRSLVKDGRVDVAGTVTLRQNEYFEGEAFNREFKTLRFEGSIPVASLCTSAPPEHAGTDADPIPGKVVGENDSDGFSPSTPEIDVGKGRAMTLLDAPGGAPIYSRPADEWGYSLKVIETRDQWMRVAAGGGPYLLGWIPAEPAHVPEPVAGTSILAAIGGVGPLDLATGDLAKDPLYELPAGATIAGPGNAVAHIVKSGYVRVKNERDTSGRVHVFASISQSMTLEGWMDPSRLGRLVETKDSKK